MAGCHPPTPGGRPQPGPPATEPCQVGKAVCVVTVDGISLIRARKFWLLDLGDRSSFDVAQVVAAAKQCDGTEGCGRAMTGPEIKALRGELAQANFRAALIDGKPVAAYRLGPQRVMLQGVSDLTLHAVHLTPMPLQGVRCYPGELVDCVLPPPPPGPRNESLAHGPELPW